MLTKFPNAKCLRKFVELQYIWDRKIPSFLLLSQLPPLRIKIKKKFLHSIRELRAMNYDKTLSSKNEKIGKKSICRHKSTNNISSYFFFWLMMNWNTVWQWACSAFTCTGIWLIAGRTCHVAVHRGGRGRIFRFWHFYYSNCRKWQLDTFAPGFWIEARYREQAYFPPWSYPDRRFSRAVDHDGCLHVVK